MTTFTLRGGVYECMRGIALSPSSSARAKMLIVEEIPWKLVAAIAVTSRNKAHRVVARHADDLVVTYFKFLVERITISEKQQLKGICRRSDAFVML
jgi:hypothetical protein